MFEWLSQNNGAIQAITAVATAAIWLVYLQLLLSGVRHQRRTSILILVGAGAGTEACCFVSNLGMDPIYLASVAVRLHYDHTSQTVDITDVPDTDLWDEAGQRTHQGPMRSGDNRTVGIIGNILKPACESAGIDMKDVRGFDITVTAFTASDSVIVAAQRGFTFDRSGGCPSIRPLTIETQQIRSLLARRRMKKELQRQL